MNQEELDIGKINLSVRFGKQVKELFSLSKNISGKTFRYEQLNGLPEPTRYAVLVI